MAWKGCQVGWNGLLTIVTEYYLYRKTTGLVSGPFSKDDLLRLHAAQGMDATD